MPNPIHGSFIINPGDCFPFLLGEGSKPGTIMVNITRQPGGDYQPLDATLHGTPAEILAWVQRILATVNEYRDGQVEDPHCPIYEGPTVALVGNPYSLPNQIRVHLEAWVPAKTDEELTAGFDAFTDDGDPVRYATWLNDEYEPRVATVRDFLNDFDRENGDPPFFPDLAAAPGYTPEEG